MALFAACAKAPSSPSAAPAQPSAALAQPSAVEAQVARGQEVYGASCAHCHGSAGEGGGAPALVGPKALPLDPPVGAKSRAVQFHTAADVAGYVVANMPPEGEKLATEDYVAVLAFALAANGVTLDEPVTGDNVGAIVLHP